jgi:ABC-type multidrug transport system, ATPase and permease components
MLKKFIRYYSPYKPLFFGDLFAALIVSAVDLSFPQILKYVTGDLIKSGGEIFGTIVKIALVLLAMYVVRFFARYFITSWGHIMGAKMESDMRRDLFYHYQKLSFSYYDRNNTGEMISKLVNDLFDVSELAHHGPEYLVISVLKLLGSFAFLMFINVPITLILFAVAVFMLVFSILMNAWMRGIFNENRKKIAAVNSRVQDSLLGIKVIKSFGNEEVEHKKFNVANEEFFLTKKCLIGQWACIIRSTPFWKD